ncbi:MAG TPA: DNA replication/repair protein RecF [Candidatus Limnocylindria bacterium]|nr:DNA replication/repair protein RecF [Candidatus Limnocylindria bacterium]
MHVEQLQLTGFRSYAAVQASFPAGPQLIVGPNAAGKTNLLEAIALLGSGHSHRASSDSELIAWGADFARLEACVSEGPGRPADRLELVLAGPGSGARKRVKVNGVPRRTSALRGNLPVVLFAPEDMLLVIGSPGLRRAALDALVVQLQPMAAAGLSTYGRALTQRNNLLRAVRDRLAAPDELVYWNGVLCQEGGRIVEWRQDTIASLADPLAAAHAEIAPTEERLSLAYVSNAQPLAGETPQAALERRLAETREKELWNGATLVGPHRDDFSFSLGRREMAGAASRGQQRSAILAFKLAQLGLLRSRDGRQPLLLLDDVFSELDPQRRAHLVRRIGELPQAFVTTTTLDDLDPSLVAASTTWRVTPGSLERTSEANWPTPPDPAATEQVAATDAAAPVGPAR